MNKAFEFADFVEEFFVPFTVFNEIPGRYNEVGKWIPGSKTARETGGIVLPLSNDELKYEANGVYTSLDRKIYTTEPLVKGEKLVYNGQSFTVDANKDYEAYADVYMYFAKGVGV